MSTPLAHVVGKTIEILVSCTDLADLDKLSKSDPMCVLFLKQFGQWKEYGRTEAVRNNLNPKFTESFLLEYTPDIQQSLMFTVYDIDSRSTDLKHHDLVGSVEMSLTEILDPVRTICTVCRTLRIAGNSKARGMISITSEAIRPSKDKLSVHVGGHGLGKQGKIITSKPDAYVELSRSIDNVYYHPVFRSETVKHSQKPRWRPFNVSVQRLCNGDLDRLIQMSVWHHSGNGDYKMLGRKVTSIRDMKLLKSEGHYKEVCLVPRKDKISKNSVKISTCGFLRFYKFSIDCPFSLLDYVRGGFQLHPIIAIDFTSSNGKPNEELCLHEISRGKSNHYLEMLNSLGSMVSQYNNEQNIAMLGFGAKLQTSETTSHCFPLSENWENIYVKGIREACKLYKKSIKRIRFSGPSKIKPIIAMAESMAVKEPTQQRQKYHVLILITDGVINDIDEAVERLISISHLPLSVIFVGVGPADFTLMESFSYHSHHSLSVENTGLKSVRKNTHFISLSRQTEAIKTTEAPSRDAFAVLSSQIVDYMKHRDIQPNRPLEPMPAAISSSRADVHTETALNDSIRLSKRQASTLSENSLRALECSGPKCPTCGSHLETTPVVHSELIRVSSSHAL